MNTGYCTNLPSACNKAANKEPIPITGPDSRCPTCGSPLIANKGNNNNNKQKLAFGTVAMVTIAAIAYVVFNFFSVAPPPSPAIPSLEAANTPSQVVANTPPMVAANAPPVKTASYGLRLSGSNTIGSALAPQLAKAWLIAKGATGVAIEQRSENGKPIPESVVCGYMGNQAFNVEILAHGSSNAFKHLQEGSADIGMASRPIKPEEAASLSGLGDMTGRNCEHVVALDGIAVIVAPGNPLNVISRQNLARIFTGEIVNWEQLGGGTGAIHVYARDDYSGTYDTFKHLVLKDKMLLASAHRFEDSKQLETAVAADSAGIGFVGLPYVQSSRALSISDSSDSLALSPTVFTVRKEDYALSRRLFLYTAANPANLQVREFVQFALSSEGQKVVKAVGFVDLTPIAIDSLSSVSENRSCELSDQWPGARNDYCQLTKGKKDMYINFRFTTGSSNLDNLAWQDLRRLLDALTKNPEAKLVLIGFADSIGNYHDNVKLSKARADSVKNALITLGVDNIDVFGFGQELAVADNGTVEGRERNRRVEVWVQ
jgi:phosphate transport system substrate-binding protein